MPIKVVDFGGGAGEGPFSTGETPVVPVWRVEDAAPYRGGSQFIATARRERRRWRDAGATSCAPPGERGAGGGMREDGVVVCLLG